MWTGDAQKPNTYLGTGKILLVESIKPWKATICACHLNVCSGVPGTVS